MCTQLLRKIITNDEYTIRVGHGLDEYHEIVDGEDEEVNRDVYIALFKLYAQSEKSSLDEQTFCGIRCQFDYNFEDVEIDVDELTDEDIVLTKKEHAILQKLLNGEMDLAVDYECDEADGEDETISEAIENRGFVLIFQEPQDSDGY